MEMIFVIRLNFDHDCSEKTARFGQCCERITDTGCFDAAPLVVETPVFSYTRSGAAQLEMLQEQVGNRDAVVFLSEICCYSYGLIQTNRVEVNCPDFPVIAQYDSLQSFAQAPKIVGHAVSANGSFSLSEPECIVLSKLPWPLSPDIVDDYGTLNPDVLYVLSTSEGDGETVYAYRILNQSKYFGSIHCLEWPVYFLAPNEIELTTGFDHYHNDSLTEYLMSLSLSFGTVNENHQDDCFAVSYRRPFWNRGLESCAFIA
jgi:hypothetical protein